jgi:7,8-dihydropterin-6-yl-methyl-4-(beta-D-ribofuranosyl)aminobenzene 5'-phosphate synthase
MPIELAPVLGPRSPASEPPLARRLVVVVENRAEPPCESAHGFCAWLEAGERVLLVDTGPDPGVLARNAARLGLDLGRVETVVLSHGHYDHTGGLPAVVAARAGRPLTVVLHPLATRARFSQRSGTPRAIGMPEASREALTAPGVCIVSSSGPTAVAPGVWVTGAIPRRQGGNDDPHLVLDPEGHALDPIEDDQAVVVETAAGLTVLCGCAHAGAVNTLDYVTQLRPGAPLALLAGGLHLGAAPDEAVAHLAGELTQRGLQRCAVGHCTGSRAEDVLAEHLPGVTRLHCASQVVLP